MILRIVFASAVDLTLADGQEVSDIVIWSIVFDSAVGFTLADDQKCQIW